jgi:DMSO/TMAO reductase YedYZ heme-binding membrane subunit
VLTQAQDWINANGDLLFAISQASAIACFIAYTLSVTAGIMLTSRTWAAPTKPYLKLHRALSIIGFLALLLHAGTVLVGEINGITPERLLLIRATPPQVMAVIAFWLAIFITLSYSIKKRGIIAQEFWRNFHYFGYMVWTLALGHALLVSQDHSPYSISMYALCSAFVCKAFWWRTHKGRKSKLAKMEDHGYTAMVDLNDESFVVSLYDPEKKLMMSAGRRTERGAMRTAKKWMKDPPVEEDEDEDPPSRFPLTVSVKDIKR